VPGGTLFSLPAPDFATVEAEGVRMRVAVNTTDPAITDINASALSPAAAASATPAEAPASSNTPWWPLLIGAAALLMVLEWLAYHRRLTV
jgi:type VI protein secretion system component VasF